MINQIFVNLPVKELTKTKKFFSSLGFAFNPQFTDEKAACLILGKNMYAMLLQEKFFTIFIPHKTISNARQSTEVLTALNVESRDAVDEMIEKVVNAGGKEYRQAQDHGWMYARAFEDPDGHVWEVFSADESKMPPEMKKRK
ncbi:glyoxalase/bleomycin resistance/extradiol dioxygenase family protein [Candidatus Woesearchaeota archaeon]|nr:glyoxalase/bleomycin resistance/extradiol dioxygenase family protein [Candidatus Woesearchaeota archaeon]